jgi:hypothetical protein
MHTQSLRPADDDSFFTITGALVTKDANFRRQLRQYLLINEPTTILMNQELSDILAKTFNLKNITSKSTLHGVFSFQIIHIAMANRIFSERATIAQDFTQLNTFPLKTVADFLNLTNAVQTFSIMFNILGCRPPFDGHDTHILVQILDTIQAKVPLLPFSIQSDVNIGLASIQKLIKANAYIDRKLSAICSMSPLLRILLGFPRTLVRILLMTRPSQPWWPHQRAPIPWRPPLFSAGIASSPTTSRHSRLAPSHEHA